MLIITLSAYSQIPSYYNNVNLTLSGSSLKDELATKIIATHTTFISYTPGVWDALKQTDIDPTDNTRVLLIYGWNDTDADITNDRTRGKDNHGSGTGVWNREHVFSKSLANPNLGTSGPGADAHNLRPCDAQRNSSRSNRKFADGSGNSGITAQGHWYPGDEWKGDVARMMMYMYLRYGNQTLPTGVAIGTANATDSNMINLFLEWNAEDPVSTVELQRNPVLEGVQGNRNPFIDNPAFATQIWGGPQAEDKFRNGSGNNDTQAPTTPIGLVSSNTTQTTVGLAWSASTDNTAVAGYQILNGTSVVGNTSSTNFTVTNLMAGTSYTFSVKAYDAANNISSASNSVSITTLTGGGSGNGTATELLISEYVEGSSNNKALEIANFTGASIDLSAYSLKKATNGGGTFSSTLNLSGTLANGQVYVIAHGSATASILNIANLTNSGVMSFNGNDAIGLFKNDILIDLLGNPTSSANFAQNVTLQRKSSTTSPNTSYTVAEWDSLATDTFSGLRNHTIDGGTPTDTTAPNVPANLVATNVTQTSVELSWSASTDNTAVTGYDVYQNDIKIATVTSTNYNVTSLDIETAYNYAVTAFDAAGNISSQSTKVFITTLPIPDTQAPTAPSTLAASNITQTSLDLNWSASTDNVAVTGYDVYQDASIIASISTTNYSISNLIEGTTYNFSLVAKDDAGNISTASNVINVTTESAPANGTTSELLISEYVEGSSNNKAIEIANFTGTTVDLSVYSLKKATNGGGTFSSSMTLSGSLANGQVYVIANSSASASILNIANTTNGSVLTFNGNDAVGLFKNDVLIDLMGNASSSTNFAQDVTLRRKTSITSPNTSYTISEWDSFSQDTFDDLGNHSIDGGVIPDTTAPTAPTNLTASNITETTVNLTWSASTDDTGITGYEVYNGVNLIGTTNNTNYSVTGLTILTSYSFSIKAKDAANNISNNSNNVNVNTIDTTAPTAPSNLIASNVGETSVDFSWSNSTDNVGVTSYDVSQDGLVIANVSSANYSVIGLTANTSYNFSVIAKDASNNASNTSNIVNIITDDIPTGPTTTQLSAHYFESGWNGWIDGGSDTKRYAGSRSYEGNYSIRIRDNSGTASAMTSPTYDLTSFDSVEVTFHFYSYSMENNEDFWLRFYDGNSWQTVETWAKGTDFQNNNFYSATVTLNASNYNFVNNAQFRFQNDASGNADHIYIDEVIISGVNGNTAAKTVTKTNSKTKFVKYLYTSEYKTFEEDFRIFPNPVTNNGLLNIELANANDNKVTFRIISLLGQVMLKGKLIDDHIKVNTLKSGMYILEINDGEEIMARKFVKK